MPKPFLVTPKVLLLMLAAPFHSALAAPPGNAPLAGDKPPPETHRPAPGGDHGAQFLATRLDTLHTALHLKPEQEPAWQKWASSVKAAPHNWKEKHPDAPTLAKMTVPERLEKMVDYARERLSRLEARLTETKEFYQVLSPDQRQTFDRDFNFWPHSGRSSRSAKPGKSLIGPRIGSQ
jgi:hypothetical protein